MVLILIMSEGPSRRNLLVSLVGGICFGALVVIRFSCKRLRGAPLNSTIIEFSDFISEQSFMDLPLTGCRLLGLITPLCQELTVLSCFQIGKPSILVCLRRGFLYWDLA
jgi:hypothetical protein